MPGGLVEAYHRLPPWAQTNGCHAQGCSPAGTQLQHRVSRQCGGEAVVSSQGHLHSTLRGACASMCQQRPSHSS